MMLHHQSAASAAGSNRYPAQGPTSTQPTSGPGQQSLPPPPLPSRYQLTPPSSSAASVLHQQKPSFINSSNQSFTNGTNNNNKKQESPLSTTIMLTSHTSQSSESANNNHNSDHILSNLNGDTATIPPTSTTNQINSSTSPPSNSTNSPVPYGELVILGYNGCLPQGEKGRRKSKYQLVRRFIPNGIKKSIHYSVKQPQTTKAIQDKERHSISFTLSRSQAIIVEYQHDDEKDMFQIGRSSENPIDFVVIDTMMYDTKVPLNGVAPNRHLNPSQSMVNPSTQIAIPYQTPLSTPATSQHSLSAIKLPQQSTISRFACRILIDRKPPYCARIYAAGFDSSKNIFLGEKSTKWQVDGEIDGLTTNGILIMHPSKPIISDKVFKEEQHQHNNQQQPIVIDETFGSGGVWREVSVCGEIYSVRETRSASQKGVKIEHETNVLQDGTLIDLCGATLMWRSAAGLARSPTKRHIEEMIDQLNASRPQCPVGLNTLVIPRRSASLGASDDKQPYVYLKCGHVQGYHDWGQSKHSNARTCPMCFKSGPIVRLSMGTEPSICISSGPPNFAFNPCGHMASEATVSYWSQVQIPHGTNGFHAMCPFCATPLHGECGYVKLIFQ